MLLHEFLSRLFSDIWSYANSPIIDAFLSSFYPWNLYLILKLIGKRYRVACDLFTFGYVSWVCNWITCMGNNSLLFTLAPFRKNTRFSISHFFLFISSFVFIGFANIYEYVYSNDLWIVVVQCASILKICKIKFGRFWKYVWMMTEIGVNEWYIKKRQTSENFNH